MQWTSEPDDGGWALSVQGVQVVITSAGGSEAGHVNMDDWTIEHRRSAATALLHRDDVVVPRAELVALYGDAPVDVPVIRRVLGVTT